MVLELAIVIAVAGAVLGLRFKVLILVPAVMFAMLFAVLVGVARADSVWSVVLLTITLAVAVQIGYLAGTGVRAAVEAIYALLVKNRNPELNSLGPAWPHTWPLNGWATPGVTARLRQPRPPRA